jgi:hypothetical protein
VQVSGRQPHSCFDGVPAAAIFHIFFPEYSCLLTDELHIHVLFNILFNTYAKSFISHAQIGSDGSGGASHF